MYNLYMKKYIPNAITVFRILIVPLFVLFEISVLKGENNRLYYLLSFFFMLILATDGIDGYLARKWNVVSEFGKLLDPIADKLIICSALFILSWFLVVPWYVTFLIIAREVIITILRFYLISNINFVLPADISGKLKTILQSISTTLVLLPIHTYPSIISSIILGTLFFAMILTVLSGYNYIHKIVKIL